MVQARPPDLNVLPERYRPRRIKLTNVVAVAVAVVLLLGLIPVYGFLTAAHAETVDLNARLSQLQADLLQNQSDRTRLEEQLAGIEGQIEQTQAQIVRLRAEFDSLSEQQPRPRSAGIAAIVAALIPRVRIVSVSQDARTFILTGQAGSQSLVLDYARVLLEGGQFADVQILSMLNTDPLGLAPEVEFSIQLEQ